MEEQHSQTEVPAALMVDPSFIDKDLQIPVGTQLRGLLTFKLANGNIPNGTPLPSIRALASHLQVAPMTVNQVYRHLRDEGLIEIRHGIGAFTLRRNCRNQERDEALERLRRYVDSLILEATRLGLSTGELIAMISSRPTPEPLRPLEIVFVGTFMEPSRSYVRDLSRVFMPTDVVDIHTFGQLAADPALCAKCTGADVVLTFANRFSSLRSMLPAANIVPLRFLASNETKRNLEAMPKGARVTAVARLEDYVGILLPAIREIAPDVGDIRMSWIGDPQLAGKLDGCDVVVYASGAETVCSLAPPHATCFEFLHTAETSEIDDVLRPELARLRRAKSADRP